MWVEVAHGGVTGFGEAQPQGHYGESLAGAEAFLDEAASSSATTPSRSRRSAGGWRSSRGNTRPRRRSTPPCTTSAGSSSGQPVWRLLGLERGGPPTSWTIWLGDPDDMARRAERAEPRFRRLKLKLGGRDGLDVERVRAVRARDRPAAPGGRERVLGARRGARGGRRARGARRRSTSSSRCRPATRAASG